jgi:hydrogenase-4 component B
MHGIVVAILYLFASGLVSMALPRRSLLPSLAGASGPVAAAILALPPSIQALTGAAARSVDLPWQIPFGSLALRLDALSALFLLPILALSALAAVYAVGYLRPEQGHRWLGPSWFFFNLLAASMIVVCIARNGLLFLIAWEVMALVSFFLVLFESHKQEAREAAWTYLVATHLGTAFLLPLFLLLGKSAGSLDFDAFVQVLPAGTANLCFALSVIGFGTKAGIIPFHIWLPEAHPAAPSHVSAVLSGVMIKTGLYGFLRILTFLGPPPLGWGWTLIGLGSVSGILGVLFALAQHDFKRLLAYHSVENIGIITLGFGVGLVGLSTGHLPVAVLGFAGGLLHVVNHALFKGLLFLGTGSVMRAAHTREMEHLGGLLRRMPWTGTCFLIGSVAICGLPPLNGFVSEFLVYFASFRGILSLGPNGSVPLVACVASLALIGGLAAACFTKAFGIIFLGEPRTGSAEAARESGPLLVVPMVFLAAACAGIGLSGPWVAGLLARPLTILVGPVDTAGTLGLASPSLGCVTLGAVALLLLIAALAALRTRLLSGRRIGQAATWDCGFAAPGARMQYTASSFAEPFTSLFRSVLRTRADRQEPTGYFPGAAHLETETPDRFRQGVYGPLFRWSFRLISRIQILQQGRIHVYVLSVVLTLLLLLFWQLR